MISNASPEIIAHRGLHTSARENTIAAFDEALAAGASAVELDVHSTADGVIVVHHDFDVAAPGHKFPIASSSYDDIREAAGSSGFDIPVLADVLSRYSGKMKVYVEVKAPNIELEVARVVRASQCELAVHSFDHRVVKRIHDFCPGLQAGILTVSRPIDAPSMLRAADAVDYWPQFDFIDRELVEDIHDSNCRVIAWTPNHIDQWDRLARLGVDGICTDRPDAYRDWLNSR